MMLEIMLVMTDDVGDDDGLDGDGDGCCDGNDERDDACQ
jgi:hypothetical protein